MTTFKEFLLETNVVAAWESRPLAKFAAADYILSNSKESFTSALTHDGVLFRGFHSSPITSGYIAAAIDPSTGKRVSKDSNNLYQLMMDSSTELVGYPSRSKSLICTSNPLQASAYGEVHVVIPKDGAKVCTIKKGDMFAVALSGIWQYSANGVHNTYPVDLGSVNESSLNMFFTLFKSHPKFVDAAQIDSAMSAFNSDELCVLFLMCAEDITDYVKNHLGSHFTTEDLDGVLRLNLYAKSGSSYREVSGDLHLVKKIARLIKGLTLPTNLNKPIRDMKTLLAGTSSSSRFTDVASKLMTPTKLGLNVIDFGDSLRQKVECWTSEQCLVISMVDLADLIENTDLLQLSAAARGEYEKSRYSSLFKKALEKANRS
jgi:hypothetical protein